jgi:hypothetical protein
MRGFYEARPLGSLPLRAMGLGERFLERSVVVSARSAKGSAMRSPVEPLDLVSGCSVVAATQRRTRPALGMDASEWGSALQSGWGRRRLEVGRG